MGLIYFLIFFTIVQFFLTEISSKKDCSKTNVFSEQRCRENRDGVSLEWECLKK